MRRTRLVRRAAAASVAALTLAALAACSDDGSSSEAAAESSPSALQGTVSEGDTVDPSAFVDGVLGSVVDATTAHLTVATSGPVELQAEGDVDYTTKPPSMAMTISSQRLGDNAVEMRLVEGVMYLALPQLGNGRFIEIDLSSRANPFGTDLTELMDPRKRIEAVKDDVTRVRYVGDAAVASETLHHYTMTVRTDAVRDLAEQLGVSGRLDVAGVIDVEVWTDDNGMLRQTQVSLGNAGSATVTISHWGGPVKIEAPPPDEVVQMPGSGVLPWVR